MKWREAISFQRKRFSTNPKSNSTHFTIKMVLWYIVLVKTTIDLPDDLVKAVKLRAVNDGRKLREEVAELLRLGLAAARPAAARSKELNSPRVKTDPKTGLPVIACRPDAPARRMSADQLIALEHETQTGEDLARLGLAD